MVAVAGVVIMGILLKLWLCWKTGFDIVMGCRYETVVVVRVGSGRIEGGGSWSGGRRRRGGSSLLVLFVAVDCSWYEWRLLVGAMSGICLVVLWWWLIGARGGRGLLVLLVLLVAVVLVVMRGSVAGPLQRVDDEGLATFHSPDSIPLQASRMRLPEVMEGGKADVAEGEAGKEERRWG